MKLKEKDEMIKCMIDYIKMLESQNKEYRKIIRGYNEKTTPV